MNDPISQPAPKANGQQQTNKTGADEEVDHFEKLPPYEGLSPFRLAVISALLMGSRNVESVSMKVDMDRISQAVKTAMVLWNRSAQSANPDAFESWRRGYYRKPLKFAEIAELNLMSKQRGRGHVESAQGVRQQLQKYFSHLKKGLDKVLADLSGSKEWRSQYKKSFLDKLESISSHGGKISHTILEHFGATRSAGFKGEVKAYQLDAIFPVPRELMEMADWDIPAEPAGKGKAVPADRKPMKFYGLQF